MCIRDSISSVQYHRLIKRKNMSRRQNPHNFEEQKEELDALEAIYLEEMQVIKDTPPYKFSIECTPFLDTHPDETADLEDLGLTIHIEFSNKYPQESAKFELEPYYDKKVDNRSLHEMEKIIDATFNRNKGSPMVFEIVEGIRDWIQHNLVDEVTRRNHRKRRNNEELVDENLLKDGEREVQNLSKKATSTTVTYETFLNWKKKFDAEMAELKKLKTAQLVNEYTHRLTGKQHFERNAGANAADEADAGDDVEEVDDYRVQNNEQNEEEDDKNLFCYDEDVFDDDTNLDDIQLQYFTSSCCCCCCSVDRNAAQRCSCCSFVARFLDNQNAEFILIHHHYSRLVGSQLQKFLRLLRMYLDWCQINSDFEHKQKAVKNRTLTH
eukprot:TRINITY_DN2796_c0_g3_i5.p2 TRINITY_DN2796_c0_g3~~TRINITY_DN2796_c0_g3_i5.p2  ORF type:complete len:397 (-),score=75.50 TRINITY_DN2796_c0_g3_i5:1481-2623(-)